MTIKPSLPPMPQSRSAEAIIVGLGRSENEPVMFCPVCAEPIPKSNEWHDTVSATIGEDIKVECPGCKEHFLARSELRFSTRREGLPLKPRGPR